MPLFPCAVCAEKEKRINDLADQVAMLRKVAFPTLGKDYLTPESIEVDKILSGTDEPTELAAVDPTAEAIDAEAARLLSGNYDLIDA